MDTIGNLLQHAGCSVDHQCAISGAASGRGAAPPCPRPTAPGVSLNRSAPNTHGPTGRSHRSSARPAPASARRPRRSSSASSSCDTLTGQSATPDRQQCRRCHQHHLRTEGAQQFDVGPRHPAVQDVADDDHPPALDPSRAAAGWSARNEPGCGVLVGAVAGVDDGPPESLRSCPQGGDLPASSASPGLLGCTGSRMPDDQGVGPGGLAGSEAVSRNPVHPWPPRSPGADIDDVGAHPHLPATSKGHPGTGQFLVEHRDDGAAAQRIGLLDLAATTHGTGPRHREIAVASSRDRSAADNRCFIGALSLLRASAHRASLFFAQALISVGHNEGRSSRISQPSLSCRRTLTFSLRDDPGRSCRRSRQDRQLAVFYGRPAPPAARRGAYADVAQASEPIGPSGPGKPTSSDQDHQRTVSTRDGIEVTSRSGRGGLMFRSSRYSVMSSAPWARSTSAAFADLLGQPVGQQDTTNWGCRKQLRAARQQARPAPPVLFDDLVRCRNPVSSHRRRTSIPGRRVRHQRLP